MDLQNASSFPRILAVLILVIAFTGRVSPSELQIKEDILSNSIQGYYIHNVPFIKQKKEFCGPANLASVLRYWDIDVTQDEIATAIYVSQLEGSLNFEMERYAKDLNLWSEACLSNSMDIKHKISRDIPVIVMLSAGPRLLERYHYVVVIGFDEARNVFIVHSGTKENAIISYNEFDLRWKDADNWTLIVCPPHKVDWPLDERGYNQLGHLFEANGDYSRAMENYNKAVKLNPTSAAAIFNIGNIHFKTGNFDAANVAYIKAIRLKPDFADAYNNMACLYIDWGNDLERARIYVHKALELNLHNWFYYLDTLGYLHIKEKKYDEAIRNFEVALSYSKRVDAKSRALVYYHMCMAYMGKGDRYEALKAYKEAIRIYPKLEMDKKTKRYMEQLYKSLNP